MTNNYSFAVTCDARSPHTRSNTSCAVPASEVFRWLSSVSCLEIRSSEGTCNERYESGRIRAVRPWSHLNLAFLRLAQTALRPIFHPGVESQPPHKLRDVQEALSQLPVMRCSH